MSHTSLSGDTLSDARIEQALRHAVQWVFKIGNLEDLTVKRIRKCAEKDLDLQDDFFKTDARWKDKSKNVIQSEVAARQDPEVASSQPTLKRAHHLPPRPNEQHRKAHGTKRASIERVGPEKRRKKDDSDAEDSTDEEEAPKKKKLGRGKAKHSRPSLSASPSPAEEKGDDISTVQNGHSKLNDASTEQSESEMSELIDEAPKAKRGRKSVFGETKTKTAKAAKRVKTTVRPEKWDAEQAQKSESEMSELIDEAPKAKRGRKPVSTESKTKSTKGAKGKKTSEEPADPDTEEIKKLQGWLVKCGIRKMWFKELAPYNSSKAKIKHLKGMLADAGMTGRYSESKAEQIKEERELKADLEAVQEGDKKWGQTTAEEDPGPGRPKRRLAKGLEGLDFLNDDDGEETD